MWLFGGIFQNGQSLCTHGCQHDVDRSTHRNHIQIDVGTEHFFAGGVDKAVIGGDSGAQSLKALDVLVDGTHAKVTSARRGNVRLPKAS